MHKFPNQPGKLAHIVKGLKDDFRLCPALP